MDQQLIKLMRQFNFHPITTAVYCLLLGNGLLSATRLEEKAAASREQIERALKQLVALRLISTDHHRGRPYYYATDPELAWPALATDLVWKVDDTPGLITELPETDNQSIEELRLLCSEMSRRAQKLYRPYVAALQHKERDAKNLEELAQLTCEAIGQAQKLIIAVNKSPRLPQVSSFWTVLSRRLEKGVRYQRIVDLDEIIEHGLSIVLRDIEFYGVDLRVLEQTCLTHSFYIVDKKLLAIFNTASVEARNANDNCGRITSQYQIITRYRKRFDHYYTNSIPARFVVTCLREAGTNLLQDAAQRLAPSELLWLESLIESGKFSRFHIKKKWSKEQLAHVEQRALAAGLVRRNDDGHIIPIYPVNEDNLRALYKATIHQ